MRALSSIDLLQVWEQGLEQRADQRALALLSAACPDVSLDALARWSIGRRDECLMTLREWAFGSALVSLAVCPACGERVELSFAVDDIRVNGGQATSDDGQEAKAQVVRSSGYEVCYRRLNSADLAASLDCPDADASRRLVLERCIRDVRREGEALGLDQLPAPVVDVVLAHMEGADPQADVQLDLICPSCSHRWLADFDIVSFFWREIDVWARRVLQQVHVLASVYGWSERAILSLSERRRQFYLEMVSAEA